jgi:hypothetical protein
MAGINSQLSRSFWMVILFLVVQFLPMKILEVRLFVQEETEAGKVVNWTS